MSAAPDPRWVILLEDGSYSLMGRHSDPTECEIIAAGNAMATAGVRGWLAIMDRSEFGRGKPVFSMVRELHDPTISFEEAVKAFAGFRPK